MMVGADQSLRKHLLTFYHDSSMGGHSGIIATYKRIKQDFYWKKMKQDMYKHIRECDTCQRCKGENVAYPGLLYPLPIREKFWHDISMDFIEGLPKASSK